MNGSLLVVALATAAGCDDVTDQITLNNDPIADAGADQTVTGDEVVLLDGRGSYDVDKDNDAMYYTWSFDYVPDGSQLMEKTAAITPNNTKESGATSFHPDAVGIYMVQLVVQDVNGAESAPDYVIITVGESEHKPVADAGDDVEVPLGSPASLDGSRSFDPLGGSLTYAWTLTYAPPNSTVDTIDSADQAVASLSGDVTGNFIASLSVNNGTANSATPDSTTVRFTGDNDSPLADGGADIDGMDCSTVQLDGRASSDPENDTIKYWWSLDEKPAASETDQRAISDQTSATPSIYVDIAGTYIMALSVFDGTSWSAPDHVVLNLAERDFNTPPVANAGPDEILDGGDADCEEDGYVYDCDDCDALAYEVGLEASDADGDPIVIEWSLGADNKGKIVGGNEIPTKVLTTKTSPEEPGACVNEEFLYTLQVTDCPGAIQQDDVILTVECCGVEVDTES